MIRYEGFSDAEETRVRTVVQRIPQLPPDDVVISVANLSLELGMTELESSYYRVRLAPVIFALPDGCAEFIIAHELGHVAHDHGRKIIAAWRALDPAGPHLAHLPDSSVWMLMHLVPKHPDMETIRMQFELVADRQVEQWFPEYAVAFRCAYPDDERFTPAWRAATEQAFCALQWPQ